MTRPKSRDGRKARKNTPIAERLMLHVDMTGECWTWTASVGNTGYGRITVDKSLKYAHRESYMAFVGPIPHGMEIDHLCRNPLCIRPTHLEAVTPSVNVRRGESPGAKALRRDACLYGHAYAEHGKVYRGRRSCKKCARIYLALWKSIPYAERMRRKMARLPIVPTGDFALAVAQDAEMAGAA